MDLDARLPTILKKSMIARIDNDRLLIGDRRAYPWEHRVVACTDVQQIAAAIRAMVTQGGGPLQVACTTMRFVARRIHRGVDTNSPQVFVQAAQLLAQARPTNTTMARAVRTIVAEISQYYLCSGMRDLHGGDLVSFVDAIVDRHEQQFDAYYDAMSDFGEQLLGSDEGILTTCFAEHSLLLTVLKAQENGKQVTVYVPETRPYLQGARLTAPALQELGIPTYVITDGAGAHFMQERQISRYMTASDLVTMDGTVVNKVGTLANAICCAHYSIPYHPFALAPDPTKHSADDIVMEERDGAEVLLCNGHPTTVDTIPARYPAFDRIDPSLVTAIITPKGVLQPSEVGSAYRSL